MTAVDKWIHWILELDMVGLDSTDLRNRFQKIQMLPRNLRLRGLIRAGADEVNGGMEVPKRYTKEVPKRSRKIQKTIGFEDDKGTSLWHRGEEAPAVHPVYPGLSSLLRSMRDICVKRYGITVRDFSDSKIKAFSFTFFSIVEETWRVT